MLSALLEREKPGLIQYARALTGNQRAGDRAVREAARMLESRSENIQRIFCERTRLYALVGALVEKSDAMDRLRLDLWSNERRLALLTDVFGFSDFDTRAILRIDQQQYDTLSTIWRGSVSQARAGRILILEDHFILAEDERSLMETHGYDVVGIAGSAEKAHQLMHQRPDVILCDIHLGTGEPTGIDFVRELGPAPDCAIVFVTAYPETYLRGEPGEPTFLVPKPYSNRTLLAVVSQALLCVQLNRLDSASPQPAPHAEH